MRILYFLLAALVGIDFALVYHLVHVDGLWQKSRQLEQELAVERQIQNRLLGENEKLNAEVKDLSTGLEIVEEVARYDLGLVREGEFFIYFLDEKSEKSTSAAKGEPADLPGENGWPALSLMLAPKPFAP